MSKKPLLHKLDINPRWLFFSFAVIALLMVLSALIELSQSKKELLMLMRQQAHHLLETTLTASRNALLSNQYLEQEIRKRLLNNASFLRRLYREGRLTDAKLAEIAAENDLFRINIIHREKGRILTSHSPPHQGIRRGAGRQYAPEPMLMPVLTGERDTLFIGLKSARFEKGFRYAVALRAAPEAAIVVNLDAGRLLEFRRRIGFGSLVRNLGQNPGIVYVALQDTSGILAASGTVSALEDISRSDFLRTALQDSAFASRMTTFENEQVFEAVHPFYFQGQQLGIFRIGLSLQPLQTINERIYRRLLIISVTLTFIGFALFSLVLVRQHLDVVKRQYQVVETYSGDIIENVSDAVVVFNEHDGLKIINRAAEQLFLQDRRDLLGKPVPALLGESCSGAIQEQAGTQHFTCIIHGQKKSLMVSRGEFRDEQDKRNIILVIRDLTEQKLLEAQMQRTERLRAMGELASGVAHEIRNPLNAIATTVQQLDRDFEPGESAEEYHEMMRVVYQQVRRINETISDFLKFARPEPINPGQVRLSELLLHAEQQNRASLEHRGIAFHLEQHWDGEVFWDQRKMLQVFMNLTQNALDAMPDGGDIFLSVQKTAPDEVEIRFRDNGPGMSEALRSKIFNLYFTTKAKGTGIGLALVQRIIADHNGMITVESSPGQGTEFIIRMPVRVQKQREHNHQSTSGS